MKELIQKIKEDIGNLDVLLFILNEGMAGVECYEEQTVKMNIDVYSDCAENIKKSLDEIVAKFGDVKLKDL